MNTHLCIVCGPLGGVDSILNVLLFVPLGVGLSLSGISLRRTILIAFAMSLAVETTQLFFIPGRDATLGDVITNTLGATLGFGLARNARFWLRPTPTIAAFLGLGWAALWLTIQLVSGFALAPSMRSRAMYGELAPELGNFDRFPGRILVANVGGVSISNARLSDADSAGRRFGGDDLVTVAVIPAYPPKGIAPILRVADAEEREILLVAQRQQEMLFAFQTGAATLRFRPPLFGLPAVFPAESVREGQVPADKLTLTGRRDPRKVTMSAQTPTEIRHTLIPVTASLGWTLVLPAQWFIEGTIRERILNSIWVAFLVLPIGYWAACAARTRGRGTDGNSNALVWGATATCLVAGFAFTPLAFTLSPTPVHEWLAALAGALLGAGLVRVPRRSDNHAMYSRT
jgi:hypothetical protein